MIIARFFLALSALLHVYFGFVFLLSPEEMMKSLSIAATSPEGMVEMRTFYGGLMIAMGCFFGLTAGVTSLVRAGAIMMTMTYLGAAVCRYIAMQIDGVSGGVIQQILYIEIGGFVSGLFSLWSSGVCSKRECSSNVEH